MSTFHILNGFKPYERGIQGKPNPLTNTPAAYCITSEDTGDIYVGSTSNLPNRLNQHYSLLRKGVHVNKKLQEAFNRDSDLKIQVRPTLSHQEAQALEQQIVDAILPSGHLCNVAVLDVTKPSLGASIPLSEAHKQRIREFNTNKIVSSETKERISNVKKAFYQTDEGRIAKAANMAAKSIPVTINDKDYSSVREASRQLGVHPRTLAQYKPRPS